jgi:hypothetical protein
MTTEPHDGENAPAVTPPDEIPPAFRSNGHSPSAMLAGLIEQLPQMLASALGSVLSQIPLRTAAQFRCVTCVRARFAWVEANGETLKAAEARMDAARAQMDDSHPMRDQLNPLMFLPEGTPPIPPVQGGSVMVQGTVYCAEHDPGIDRAGRPSLLVVEGALSHAALAGFMQA